MTNHRTAVRRCLSTVIDRNPHRDCSHTEDNPCPRFDLGLLSRVDRWPLIILRSNQERDQSDPRDSFPLAEEASVASDREHNPAGNRPKLLPRSTTSEINKALRLSSCWKSRREERKSLLAVGEFLFEKKIRVSCRFRCVDLSIIYKLEKHLKALLVCIQLEKQQITDASFEIRIEKGQEFIESQNSGRQSMV